MRRSTSRLLIDESPLQVLPSLAVAIGLNEAIVLQQVHYWLKTSKHEHDGRRWIYNTLDAWHAQFPFFSVRTIQRIFERLREAGLLLSGNYNAAQTDRTLWYSIDYEVLDALQIEPSPDLTPSGQVDHMPSPFSQTVQMEDDNLSTSSSQPVHMLIEQRLTPETTSKRGGGDTRTRTAAAAISQTEKDLMAAGGLNLKQARTAVSQQEFTVEIIGRITVWADKLRAAGKNPGAILCGYTDAGQLPDDLPRANTSRRPRTQSEIDDFNRRVAVNPSLLGTF